MFKVEILQSFNNKDLGSDAQFYLNYVSYIVDSSRTPFMILDSDSTITSCGNIHQSPQQDGALIGTKVTPQLLALFADNPPFHYQIWGIPLTLLYRESQIYSDMRAMLDNLNRSFLSEVTNNSVFVPAIVGGLLRLSVAASRASGDEPVDRDACIEEQLRRGVLALAKHREHDVHGVDLAALPGLDRGHVHDLLQPRRDRQRAALHHSAVAALDHRLHRL